MNDMIYNWLKDYPGLELLQWQQVDAVPGGCGLFFRGVTVEEDNRDLLGSVLYKKTLHFRLFRYGQPEESAVFFLMMETWLETEPPMGTVAALKNTRCIRDVGQGLALWEAELDITYWETQ